MKKKADRLTITDYSVNDGTFMKVNDELSTLKHSVNLG